MIALIDQGVIGPVRHLTPFCISQLESTMSSFSKGVHTGKYIITFHNPEATLKVRSLNYHLTYTVRLTCSRLRDLQFGPYSIQMPPIC